MDVKWHWEWSSDFKHIFDQNVSTVKCEIGVEINSVGDIKIKIPGTCESKEEKSDRGNLV